MIYRNFIVTSVMIFKLFDAQLKIAQTLLRDFVFLLRKSRKKV
jgi:hypothetical protein